MTLNARLYLYQCIANFVFPEVAIATGGILPFNTITAAAHALSYNVTAQHTLIYCDRQWLVV